MAGCKMNGKPTPTRGFTLIEMMVAISIIVILLAVAMPIYSHSITRAKEQNLRKNLQTLNHLIYQYAQDKQKSPQSLSDLVSSKYIDKIPDDITGSNTWVTEPAEGTIMSRSQVSGLRSQVSGLRSQVSGLRSQVSGLRSQVSGLRSQKRLESPRSTSQ
jgi:general secretion pathway protein G